MYYAKYNIQYTICVMQHTISQADWDPYTIEVESEEESESLSQVKNIKNEICLKTVQLAIHNQNNKTCRDYENCFDYQKNLKYLQ